MASKLEDLFPNLIIDGFRVTSPPTDEHNCIAWAAQITKNWWWPGYGPRNCWPPDVRRDETFQAVVDVFELFGFSICDGPVFVPGYEKVALYSAENSPTHAARQLPSGLWTSKLGQLEDIEHTLRGLEGDIYGAATVFLKRPAKSV